MNSDLATTILTISALTVSRNGNRLLDNVSATVARGSITLLMGHNGAGKTVLMNCLHGLMAYDSGKIDAPPRAQQKMVFQKPIMLRRSARQHLKFLCPLLVDAKIEALLARADLIHRADTPARALSGGEQQKLALIGALATHPDILFLDEPTAHLDFEATKSIESMIREAHDGGTSILMTSHNRAQAERLAQHVLLLDKGMLVESTPAQQFFSAPSHPLARHYLDHV